MTRSRETTNLPDSPRALTIAIIGSAIVMLLGIGVWVFSGFQGPIGNPVLGLIGSVMMVGGFCLGMSSITRLREFNKYDRPRMRGSKQ